MTNALNLNQRLFTVADVYAMVGVGIIDQHERVELVDGILVQIEPKGIPHERIKRALTDDWYRSKPETDGLIVATTLRADAYNYFEPDITIFDPAGGIAGMSPKTVKLVIEIADHSLAYDLGPKAKRYAFHGLRELWVIDARTMVLTRHLAPSGDGYGTVTTHGADETVIPTFADPAFALRLSSLDLV